MSAPYEAYNDMFAYYFKPRNGKPTPAIFQLNAEKPGFAWLYLMSHNKQTVKVVHAIEVAAQDLTFAIQVAESISALVPSSQTVRAALFQRGYDWPGFEKVEIEIPPELLNRRA